MVYIELTKVGDDLLGFYKQLLLNLLAVDPALNEDIDFITLDLSKVENLSEGDKQALCYLLWTATGTQVGEGTIETLKAEGRIKVEGSMQQIERGILCSIEIKSSAENNFVFTASKFRSSLGAYGFADCEANLEHGVWSYTIGWEFIS